MTEALAPALQAEAKSTDSNHDLGGLPPHPSPPVAYSGVER